VRPCLKPGHDSGPHRKVRNQRAFDDQIVVKPLAAPAVSASLPGARLSKRLRASVARRCPIKRGQTRTRRTVVCVIVNVLAVVASIASDRIFVASARHERPVPNLQGTLDRCGRSLMSPAVTARRQRPQAAFWMRRRTVSMLVATRPVGSVVSF
jgi:hypothetical protein